MNLQKSGFLLRALGNKDTAQNWTLSPLFPLVLRKERPGPATPEHEAMSRRERQASGFGHS